MIRLEWWYLIHRVDEYSEHDTQHDTHRRELRIHIKSERECAEESGKKPPEDMPIFI